MHAEHPDGMFCGKITEHRYADGSVVDHSFVARVLEREVIDRLFADDGYRVDYHFDGACNGIAVDGRKITVVGAFDSRN